MKNIESHDENSFVKTEINDNLSNLEQFSDKNESDFDNLTEESVQINTKNDTLSENNTNLAETSEKFNENLQNSSVLNKRISEFSCDSNTTLEHVSEFSTQINSENLKQNVIFSISSAEKSTFERFFPGVTIEKVQQDPNFRLFADGKEKSKSISEIYKNYLYLIKQIANDIEIKTKVAHSNKIASPGSLSSSGAVAQTFFTKDQVKRMSREQIARNYQEIRQSQQKW